MHHTLKAYTDAGTFVFFDPGSVRYILRGEMTLEEFDLDREVNEGRVLAYSAGGDGDVLVRAYVDEAPEDRIEEHAEENLDGALLRVPTGRLIFSGLEDLSPVPNEQIDRSDDVQPRTGVVVHIPAGEYRVRAFDVDWGRHYENAVGRIKTSWDRQIDWWIGPAMGCAMAATVFVIPGDPAHRWAQVRPGRLLERLEVRRDWRDRVLGRHGADLPVRGEALVDCGPSA